MDGTKVKGYWLLNESTGAYGYMQKDKADQLALAKMISNCTAQYYQGVVTLKGNGFKVQKLPKYDIYGNRVVSQVKKKSVRPTRIEPEYALVQRVVNSKQNTGFFAVDLRTGSKVFLTREEVIELASAGKIKDVKANKSKDKYILRGTKASIEDLPVIQPINMRHCTI